MKKNEPLNKRTLRLILFIVCAAALGVAFLVAQPQPVAADDTVPPSVPANIQVPAGNDLFFVGHAVGTQNYVCLPVGTGVRFVLFTPQATLFDLKEGTQVATHYFGPNPDEGGIVRAAWQHSRDTSTVWGRVLDGNSSSDPQYVAPGAIAWFLITVVGSEDGPANGDKLAAATYIQRVNTTGGVAPSTGCATLSDVDNQAFVPYTADYYFYR